MEVLVKDPALPCYRHQEAPSLILTQKQFVIRLWCAVAAVGAKGSQSVNTDSGTVRRVTDKFKTQPQAKPLSMIKTSLKPAVTQSSTLWKLHFVDGTAVVVPTGGGGGWHHNTLQLLPQLTGESPVPSTGCTHAADVTGFTIASLSTPSFTQRLSLTR